jgi:hypothetical protein
VSRTRYLLNPPLRAPGGATACRPYAAIASARAAPGQATQGVTYTHRPSGLTSLATSPKPWSVLREPRVPGCSPDFIVAARGW